MQTISITASSKSGVRTFTLFYSLEWNAIGHSGAAVLADALTVNQSLKTLK